MQLQLEPVAEWADLVTVHSIAGTNSIEALQTVDFYLKFLLVVFR